MKGTLKKDLPIAKAGTIIDVVDKPDSTSGITFYNANTNQTFSLGEIWTRDIPEWIDIIVEKKRYEDLKNGNQIFVITARGEIEPVLYDEKLHKANSRIFLTREEAEDEHKRREWAVRPDRIIPEIGEEYFYPTQMGYPSIWTNQGYAGDYLVINSGLAFRTEEDCAKAIKEHDIVRLFYKIR